MENLKEKIKLVSDLECEIDDIQNKEDFSSWLEHALQIIESIWGKSSTQYINAKSIKRYYILLPLDSFNLKDAINDAIEIIEICNEGLL